MPHTLQMEAIDLQCNDAPKIKYREETLVDLYKFFPGTQYPNLQKFAIEYICMCICYNLFVRTIFFKNEIHRIKI